MKARIKFGANNTGIDVIDAGKGNYVSIGDVSSTFCPADDGIYMLDPSVNNLNLPDVPYYFIAGQMFAENNVTVAKKAQSQSAKAYILVEGKYKFVPKDGYRLICPPVKHEMRFWPAQIQVVRESDREIVCSIDTMDQKTDFIWKGRSFSKYIGPSSYDRISEYLERSVEAYKQDTKNAQSAYTTYTASNGKVWTYVMINDNLFYMYLGDAELEVRVNDSGYASVNIYTSPNSTVSISQIVVQATTPETVIEAIIGRMAKKAEAIRWVDSIDKTIDGITLVCEAFMPDGTYLKVYQTPMIDDNYYYLVTNKQGINVSHGFANTKIRAQVNAMSGYMNQATL